MPDRKNFISALWLTFSLALLASIVVVPIRTPRFVCVASSPDCARRSFAPLPTQPTTRLKAAIATNILLELNALPFENEEQDRTDALDEPRISFQILCSSHKAPDRQLIVPSSILSLYPLRC